MSFLRCFGSLKTFKDSYNGLSFGLCDNLFRSVVDVSLDSKPSGSVNFRRHLQSAETLGIGAAANGTFLNGTFLNGTLGNQTIANSSVPLNETNVDRNTVFTITGQCRGCPITDSGYFNLFDDAFRRRRKLKVSASSHSSLQRKLQNDLGLCVCPIGVEPDEEDTGPSAEEFLEIFNTKIEEEQESGSLVGVNITADSIVEGQFVNCEPVENGFRSEIFSDLQLNLTSITQEEVAVLEDGT